MARIPTLKFDRGTLILHPPPRGKAWIDYATWDDRIEKFRVPAFHYRNLIETLQAESSQFVDEAGPFVPLEVPPLGLSRTPYPHQREALEAWKQAGRQGVVVLPTGSGKSYLALMAMVATLRTTLVVVPTLDLMHQWYAQLETVFTAIEVGLLGGGSHDRSPILVATYDSAAIHAEKLGNCYGLVIFDECHHLPSDFNRVIAEYTIAPYRLGLTATPERGDGRHQDLDQLIGPEIYRKRAADLSGVALAPYEVRQIKVQLTTAERERYTELLEIRNRFLRQSNLSLGGLKGWQRFVQISARSSEGRQAILAHHEAKAIALGTTGKLTVLGDLLAQHYPEQVLIFTNDNTTVYRISQDFLIPAITHQTPVKERHEILTRFRDNQYKNLVVANVLDEGVDVPDVRIAIFLAGTGSTRQFVQRLGRVLRRGSQVNKQAILYEVVAEDTVEEGTSRRRRSEKPQPQKPRQLEIVPPVSYGAGQPELPRVAEKKEPGDGLY
jgi:superfamily II DNA or RNA helicase